MNSMSMLNTMMIFVSVGAFSAPKDFKKIDLVISVLSGHDKTISLSEFQVILG